MHYAQTQQNCKWVMCVDILVHSIMLLKLYIHKSDPEKNVNPIQRDYFTSTKCEQKQRECIHFQQQVLLHNIAVVTLVWAMARVVEIRVKSLFIQKTIVNYLCRSPIPAL